MMEAKDAINRIKYFGLHHAIGDLPKSNLTVEAFNKAIEILRLEENGLLHISPCKNGTEIFYLTDKDFMDFEKIVVKGSYLNGYTEYYYGEVGIGFFLTRDEAELKLKEMKK